MRFIPWWALALVLLVCLGWVFRVTLVEVTVDRILASRGISNVGYKLRDIDFSRIALDSFHATGDTGDIVFDIAATTLEIGYRIDNLASGEIEEAFIGDLDFVIQTTPVSDASPPRISDILELLESRFSLGVPVKKLDIQRMTVVYGENEVLSGAGVAGQFSPDTNQVSLSSGDWNADVSWSGHTAGFKLNNADPPKPILSATISLDPASPTAGFSSSLEAEATEAAQWITALASLPPPEVSGSLDFSVRGTASNNRWDLQLELIAPILGTVDMGLDSLYAKALVSIPDALDFANLSVEIPEPGRITMDSLSTPEVILSDVRIETEGTINLSDREPLVFSSRSSTIVFSQLESGDIQSGPATMDYMGTVAVDENGLEIAIDPGSRFQTQTLTLDDIELSDLRVEPTGVLQVLESGTILLESQPTAIDFTRFDSEDIRSGSATVNYAGTATVDENGFQIVIGNGSRLVTPALHVDDITLGDLSVESRAPSNLAIYPDSWRLEDGNFALDRVSLEVEDVSVRFNDTTMEVSLATEDELAASFAAAAPEIYWQEIDSGISEIEGVIEMQNDLLETRGTMMLAGIQTSMAYRTSTNLTQNLTTFKLASEETLAPYEIFGLGGGLIPELIPGLTFDSGEIQVAVSGTIPDQGDADFQLEANATDLNGLYTDATFSDANLTVVTRLADDAATGSAAINVGTIEFGVDINNIGCELAFKVLPSALPVIEIDSCMANTLGSQIEAPGFTFDMNEQENSLQLDITGLDIATVLETQQFEGLEATGELDGTLPVSLGPNGLSISGGKLQSRSAGTIRYQLDPDQAASVSNPLTDVVIDALSDFNYDVLAAEVNYDPAGDLFVGFRIEGSSPNFEKGRPVHLNINTEQNILSLLESLRYADNLNQQIDDKVRKNQE